MIRRLLKIGFCFVLLINIFSCEKKGINNDEVTHSNLRIYDGKTFGITYHRYTTTTFDSIIYYDTSYFNSNIVINIHDTIISNEEESSIEWHSFSFLDMTTLLFENDTIDYFDSFHHPNGSYGLTRNLLIVDYYDSLYFRFSYVLSEQWDRDSTFESGILYLVP